MMMTTNQIKKRLPQTIMDSFAAVHERHRRKELAHYVFAALMERVGIGDLAEAFGWALAKTINIVGVDLKENVADTVLALIKGTTTSRTQAQAIIGQVWYLLDECPPDLPGPPTGMKPSWW